MAIASTNPATGETFKTFDPLSDAEIEAKLARAEATFQHYRKTTFAERGAWLREAANLLEAGAETYGALIASEMGKTLQSAIAEVKKCALGCRFYAENAPDFLANISVETDASTSYIAFQPLGAILAVMPWNFPFWQVFRCAAPALMAGNVCVLKHASNVPQSALAIEEIIRKAGFPEGAFQTLLVGASKVAQIVGDRRIKAAALTGSESAGASLAAAAGKHIKKTVLELGGTDPFIVLDSADLDAAATAATLGRTLNSGQSCVAAKRLILHEAIADSFQQRLLDKFVALQTGDPLDAATDLGPLATPAILTELDAQVRATVEKGAKVLCGGRPLDRPGNFYPPTILADIPPGTPADEEEFFGPVALLFRVRDLDAAIALANSTPLGLGASAWTASETEAQRCIDDLEAGAVFINGFVKSDPRLPFGGIKNSGYGRELGVEGIREFVNIKTVWKK